MMPRVAATRRLVGIAWGDRRSVVDALDTVAVGNRHDGSVYVIALSIQRQVSAAELRLIESRIDHVGGNHRAARGRLEKLNNQLSDNALSGYQRCLPHFRRGAAYTGQGYLRQHAKRGVIGRYTRRNPLNSVFAYGAQVVTCMVGHGKNAITGLKRVNTWTKLQYSTDACIARPDREGPLGHAGVGIFIHIALAFRPGADGAKFGSYQYLAGPSARDGEFFQCGRERTREDDDSAGLHKGSPFARSLSRASSEVCSLYLTTMREYEGRRHIAVTHCD